MPNIPIPVYEQQTRAPGAVPLARAFVPDNTGEQAIAQAFTHVGDNVQRLEERDGALEASTALSSLRMGAMKILSDAKDSAKDDAAGFTPAVMQSLKDQTEQTLGALKSPYAKPLVKERAQEIAEQVYGHALQFEGDARKAYRVSAVKDSTDRLQSAILADPNSYKSAAEEQMLAIEAMQLPPQERVALRDHVTQSAVTAAALGYTQQDPALALKRLADPSDPVFGRLSLPLRDHVSKLARVGVADHIAAGVMDAYAGNVFNGSRALAGIAESKTLDDATKQSVQKEVNERLSLFHSERRQLYVKDLAALHADLADGNPPDDAEARAFKLYARGAITEEGYAGMAESIERARIERGKKKVDLQLGLSAIQNGVPLDPSSDQAKKSIDAAFQQLAAGVPRGTPEYQNRAVEVARRTNVPPADALNWARTAITSGQPEPSVQAAQFLDRLQAANPRAYGYVSDDKMKSFAEQVNSAIAAGSPAQLAVATATKNTYELAPQQRELLEKQYSLGGTDSLSGKHVEMRDNNRSDLQSRLNGDDRFDTSFLSMGGAPSVSPQMTAEYDDAVKRYYLSTNGNLDAARNLAWKDITTVWGRSVLNGTPQMMKYAPEAMYPQLPPTVIRNDIEATAKVLQHDDKPVEGKHVQLVPSADTAFTGGLEWRLGVPGKYGDLEILTGRDGRALRYQLPVTSSAYTDAAARLKAEEIAKARTYSKQQRQYQDALMERLNAGDESAAVMLTTLPSISEGIK